MFKTIFTILLHCILTASSKNNENALDHVNFTDEQDFESNVIESKIAWLIALIPENISNDNRIDGDFLNSIYPNWSKFTKPLHSGHLRAGVFVCSNAESFSKVPCSKIISRNSVHVPTVVVYSHGFQEDKSVNVYPFEDFETAQNEAYESVPNLVDSVSMKNDSPEKAQDKLSKYISYIVNMDTKYLDTHFILVVASKSKNPHEPLKPSILMKSLALEFEDVIKVFNVVDPSSESAAQFGINKIPGLTLLFNVAGENFINTDDPDKQKLTGMGYSPKEFGPMNFNSISSWIRYMDETRRSLMDHEIGSDEEKSQNIRLLEKIEMVEITAENWGKGVCTADQAELCLIVLLASEANERFEDIIDVLEKSVVTRGDGSNPWQLLYVKADCQFEFVSGMGFERDVFTPNVLPSLFVFSPKKMIVSHMNEEFDAESIKKFLNSVLSAKAEMKVLRQAVEPVDRNCSEFLREMFAEPVSDDNLDDIMGEILLEEEKKRKELEEEIERQMKEIESNSKKPKKKGKKKKKTTKEQEL
mmetsp:Transcript_12462/g.18717  ORF Transcript_12462/g.18717 Transcript_12462/m.18717 type:complete len:530 (+) Transcript_12462:3-1592(+)